MNKKNNKPVGDVPQPVLMDVTLGGKVKHAAALTWWRTKLMSKAVHLYSTGFVLGSAGLVEGAAHAVATTAEEHGLEVVKDYDALVANKPTLTFLPAIEDKPAPKATPKYVDMGTEYTL